jgi:thiamine biosynthesis lipoprotein
MRVAERTMMGGSVSVHVRPGAGSMAAGSGPFTSAGAAQRATTRAGELAAERALDRLGAWAARLTRFDDRSELSRLNASTLGAVPVGPTLTAVLDWARTAESMTGGRVDVAMLDARLAAEAGTAVTPPLAASRRWSLVRGRRGSLVVREPGVRLDLDGVAKGWLADRTLDLVLGRDPGVTALVDGDGDVAAWVQPGDELLVGVGDPATEDGTLAIVRLAPGGDRPQRFGIATSGTSVHRWARDGATAHHLIDPVTWRPAQTDVVQATVLADTARAAEAFAKAAVLAGSDLAAEILGRPGVHGGLLLTAGGEIRATPGMLPWLA